MPQFVEKSAEKMTKLFVDGLSKPERVCPYCAARGFFFNEFEFKGKDKGGLLYFECHVCKKIFSYDTLNGGVETLNDATEQ